MNANKSARQFPTPIIALQYRDYRNLWLGQLLSQFGTQMQIMTIAYHVDQLTHSAIALGLLGLMRVIPIVVFSLIGGLFADARDRRRVMLVTQTVLMLCAAMLGLTTLLGIISVPIIYALAALIAATMAFDGPARQSLAPNLVPKEHLTNALSLNNIMHQSAAIVGPALGGFVIAGFGIAAVYWLNAASFLAILAALVVMKTPTQQNLGATRIHLVALTEGIRFVWRAKLIRATMLLDFFATFFSSANALLPLFAREILRVGPEGLGFLYAAESVGAVIAGVGMAFAGKIKRQGAILLASVAAYGGATALFGASPFYALTLVALALVGASDTVGTILRNTIRQLATPDHLRGRMTSVNMIFFMGGPQLGNFEAGIVAALFGAPFAVISGGVATVILVAVTAWLVPQLRDYVGSER
jgi:MFS family permease